MIHKIRDEERHDQSEIVLMREDPNNAEFWAALGDPKQKKKIAPDAGDDTSFLNRMEEQLKIYKIADTDEMELISCQKKESHGLLVKSILEEEHVYLIDGGNEVYVWVVKLAPAGPKKLGIVRAHHYL